jgi:hypothetical protein
MNSPLPRPFAERAALLEYFLGLDREADSDFRRAVEYLKDLIAEQLFTLLDAGSYITKLPKAEHEAPDWQAAMEALILVATLGRPATPAGYHSHDSAGII